MISIWRRMNSSCYCLSVRAGALIVLWLALIIFGLHTVHIIFIHETLYLVPRIMVSAFTLFLGVVPSAMGVLGVYMRKPEYLIPFIIISIIHVTLTLILALIYTFILIVNPSVLDDKDFSTPEDRRSEAVKFVVGFDVSTILVSLLYWYIINVVRSYYLLLLEARKEPRPDGSSAASAPQKK